MTFNNDDKLNLLLEALPIAAGDIGLLSEEDYIIFNKKDIKHVFIKESVQKLNINRKSKVITFEISGNTKTSTVRLPQLQNKLGKVFDSCIINGETFEKAKFIFNLSFENKTDFRITFSIPFSN